MRLWKVKENQDGSYTAIGNRIGWTTRLTAIREGDTITLRYESDFRRNSIDELVISGGIKKSYYFNGQIGKRAPDYMINTIQVWGPELRAALPEDWHSILGRFCQPYNSVITNRNTFENIRGPSPEKQ